MNIGDLKITLDTLYEEDIRLNNQKKNSIAIYTLFLAPISEKVKDSINQLEKMIYELGDKTNRSRAFRLRRNLLK